MKNPRSKKDLEFKHLRINYNNKSQKFPLFWKELKNIRIISKNKQLKHVTSLKITRQLKIYLNYSMI